MVVPGGVEEADAADATFHHPAGEQAVEGELVVDAVAAAAAALALVRPADAVHVQRFLRLAGEIDQLRRGHLHAEGQLVSSDTAVDLRVADLLMPLTV